ncbi:MAG TPA: DUF1961 family protein, partial [Armatimonadota bacterium]|nr:DUF1961 family protein [Armatimonadota bacterium]
MDIRGLVLVAMMLACVAACAQEPRLILRASFDGDLLLQPGGPAQALSAQFVEGREGQAVRASEPDKMAAAIPLGEVNTRQGTLMFWFRTDLPTPGLDEPNHKITPVRTAGGLGPEVSIVRSHPQTAIAIANPWGKGGPNAVFSEVYPGKWYHLAYTWNADEADVCLWLFGVAYGDTLGKWRAGEPSDTPWDATLQVGTPDCAIDDLRIYDGAMTAEQIIAAAGYRDGECMTDEGKVFFDTTLDSSAIKGELIYEDGFDRPWADNWVLEGPGALTQEGGRLRMQEQPAEGQNGNVVLWCKQDFPRDFVCEWEFTPNDVEGLCIVFFCAQGLSGEDIFDPSLAPRDGTFTGYTNGDIHCYHISYFRNTCGRSPNCALRKNPDFYR